MINVETTATMCRLTTHNGFSVCLTELDLRDLITKLEVSASELAETRRFMALVPQPVTIGIDLGAKPDFTTVHAMSFQQKEAFRRTFIKDYEQREREVFGQPLLEPVVKAVNAELEKLFKPFKKRSAKMAMSNDRVEFQLNYHMWNKGPKAYRQILFDVFNLQTGEYSEPCSGRPLTVICRPSQFARFIILRHEAIEQKHLGGVNTIAEMKPRLFVPAKNAPVKVDVSTRSNHL